ncbi:hypothetical protein Mapa_015362 [Marchantia paleacea]|nr:hypothetical protein Mapa_015362 [Marchantia paleacea]
MMEYPRLKRSERHRHNNLRVGTLMNVRSAAFKSEIISLFEMCILTMCVIWPQLTPHSQ